MFKRLRRWARRVLACSLVITSAGAAAEDNNIWRSTFGQVWFYETGTQGQLLAGTWWESSLTPGKTYSIAFEVVNRRGNMALLVGDNPAVEISAKGTYSFDFHIREDGKRRMAFIARAADVMASVARIEVKEKWSSQSDVTGSSAGNWIPKGHYLSFAKARNLKTEMMDLIDRPWTAPSDYAMRRAESLDDALSTPGVKGFWMEFDWRTIEVGDGQFDWQLLDANMSVARRYGLKMLVKISDRSFDGSNPLPRYFPSEYAIWTTGGGKSGFVSKRWDPYVYRRTIRLYTAIANRYAQSSEFGGIATTETALGSLSSGSGYSVSQYRQALTQVATQTHSALKRGRLFLYLNFIKGGDNVDMNKDMRVKLLSDLPHESLVVGAPDITPDLVGMPGSASSYRVHARKTMPGLSQFCHLQHVDQGLNGTNVKNNQHRDKYLQTVAATRERERQSWFSGEPAVFQFDDLRDPNGSKVQRHPDWVLGKLWQPEELFAFGRRDFGCDYVLWHYREHVTSGEFTWPAIQNVILNHQYFYD